MNVSQIVLAVFLLSSSVACTPSLMWQWAPPASLNAKLEPDMIKNADAVYLLREYRFLKYSRWGSGQSYEQQQVHEVIKILTERAREGGATKVRVEYPKKGDIVSFEARTIQADGTVVPLEPEDVYDDDLVKDHKRGNDWKVRVFAFPKVKVGSIIEYQYTRQLPWVLSYDWGFINHEKWPTLKYRLELMGTKDIRYALSTYNSQVEWKQETEGKFWKLSWETENLPPSPKGLFRGDRKFYDPWWAFRVSQYVKYNHVAQIYSTWDYAFDYRANKLYFEPGDYYDDWKADFAADECKGDVRCIVKAARKNLGAIPLKNCKNKWSGRPLKRISETKWISNGEYARALWKMLQNHDVKATFAAPAGRYWDFWDRDFPAPQELDGGIVLQIPKQQGLEKPLWIDPCCPYCKLGEMPVWSRGTQAYLLHATKNKFDKRARLKGIWAKAEGTAPIRELEQEKIDVKISLDGQINVSMTENRFGRSALKIYQSSFDRKEKKWKDKTRSMITGRVENAELQHSDSGLNCEPDLSRCSRKTEYAIKAYATVDGDDLFLPLTFLDKDWHGFFKRKVRKIPIRIDKPFAKHDIIEITPPKDYELVSTIKSSKIKGPVFSGKISSTKTESGVRIERLLKTTPGIYNAETRKAFQKATDSYAAVRNAVLHFRRAPKAGANP